MHQTSVLSSLGGTGASLGAAVSFVLSVWNMLILTPGTLRLIVGPNLKKRRFVTHDNLTGETCDLNRQFGRINGTKASSVNNMKMCSNSRSGTLSAKASKISTAVSPHTQVPPGAQRDLLSSVILSEGR